MDGGRGPGQQVNDLAQFAVARLDVGALVLNISPNNRVVSSRLSTPGRRRLNRNSIPNVWFLSKQPGRKSVSAQALICRLHLLMIVIARRTKTL
jgi:hypothetical protein